MMERAGLCEAAAALRQAIRARIDAGLTTQSAIARHAGVSQGYVSSVLARNRRPTIFVLDQLAEAAGVELRIELGPTPHPRDRA